MRRLSGGLRSALVIGGQGIRARKTRTLLSMISLFLGVLAVVVVQAAAQTAEEVALANVELTNGIDGTLHLYVNGGEDAINAAVASLAGRPDAVGVSATDVVIGEPNVVPLAYNGTDFVGSPFGYGGRPDVQCDASGYCVPVFQEDPSAGTVGAAIDLQLLAMTGDIRQFKPFRSVAGQWLDFSGPPSYSPGLVLNTVAAKGFSEYRIPAEMRITGAADNPTPRIIGVVDDGQHYPCAYTRLDELQTWQQQTDDSSTRGIRTNLDVYAAPGATQSLQLLRTALSAHGVDEQSLFVDTIQSRRQVESTLTLLRLVFFGMAGLVLLIGVAGVLNVGLATVGERVEEFALRRAVGTSRLLLAGIVLAETMITGVLTAGAAIGVAAAALRIARPILDDHYTLRDISFPWQAGVAGVVAGLLAGVLGGLVPAVRAARIPIATVMRA